MDILFPVLVVLLVFNVGVFCGFILGAFLRGATPAGETVQPEKQFEHEADAHFPRAWK